MSNTGQDLYAEAKRLIPSGSNLFSKRAELHHPTEWPAYYSSARGVTITDLDGRAFRDFSGAGVGAAVLGYTDPDVDAAVIKAIGCGSTSALLAPEEVELAKMLTTIHPWAKMVRFARSGGEAMAIAMRIALHGDKDKTILTNSYHGWHVNDPLTGESFLNDEYTMESKLPNTIEKLGYWATSPPGAIIMEPARLYEPTPSYLKGVRAFSTQTGTVLIFDEISSGFRRNLGGVHLHYGVNPDIAVFSKAMSNGYPMAAVIGTEEVMSAAQDTFISSTTWSERIGPAAAIATIQKFWAYDVHEHLKYIGDLVKGTIEWESKQSGIKVVVSGFPQMLHFEFGSPEVQTLYTQLMLDRGFLAGRDFYPSYAHTIEDCEDFAEAVREVFPLLHDTSLLRGPAAESGIKR